MKKIKYIVMALALIMSLTQCKKNAVLNEIDYNMIDITINVANDSRINVNTTIGDENLGQVTFERYDHLHIVSDGKYCGSVEHNGTAFTGKITEPTEGVPMYIYFFGVPNVHYDYKKLVSGVTSCTVNITDQKDKLPVISCGITANYSSSTSSYDVKLMNKCALVMFDVTTSAADEPTCLTELKNEMVIDFTNNTFTPGSDDAAIIKLPKGSGKRWAILLPSAAENTTSRAFSQDYSYVGTRSALGAINYNDLITTGCSVTVDKSTLEDPTYNDKKFSLSPEKRVSFAPGNVQHVYDSKKGTCVWKFAEHQYDVLHNENTQQHEGTCNRDRFGWGTGNNPDLMSHSNADYPQSTSAFIDWGSKFPEAGKNPWFTPKCVEWRYLMFERPATSLNGIYNARYARARVAGVNGVILFPDVYNHPSTVALPTKASINFTTNNDGSYSVNDYTVEQWNEMESAGAVFLPVTGFRQYNNNAWEFSSTGEVGHYWTQCDLDQNSFACDMYFTDYRTYVQDHNDKCKGFAVRLVRE